MQIKVNIFAIVVIFALSCANACAETLVAKLAWQYQGLPASMKTYELKPGIVSKLWLTETTKDLSSLPIGKEIANGELRIEKGAAKRFVLVFRNVGSKPIYFFASPHHAEPAEFSLGFKFKCLCIDHAFTVPPGETWYRVVELRTSRDMTGSKITLTHALIGIDEARMKLFSMKQPQLD